MFYTALSRPKVGQLRIIKGADWYILCLLDFVCYVLEVLWRRMIRSLCVMNWVEYNRKLLWPVEGAQRFLEG